MCSVYIGLLHKESEMILYCWCLYHLCTCPALHTIIATNSWRLSLILVLGSLLPITNRYRTTLPMLCVYLCVHVHVAVVCNWRCASVCCTCIHAHVFKCSFFINMYLCTCTCMCNYSIPIGRENQVPIGQGGPQKCEGWISGGVPRKRELGDHHFHCKCHVLCSIYILSFH